MIKAKHMLAFSYIRHYNAFISKRVVKDLYGIPRHDLMDMVNPDAVQTAS